VTGETRASVSGWTIDTLAAHHAALREADLRFEAERDRRYAEVKNAEEKALKVKEEADKTALGLQRENQQYKDEKANQLREQISSERGLYATKGDLVAVVEKVEVAMKPLATFVSSQQGRTAGLNSGWVWILGALGAVSTFASLAAMLAAVVMYVTHVK
jgi:vacuolar-type H+-ATPase subunit H